MSLGKTGAQRIARDRAHEHVAVGRVVHDGRHDGLARVVDEAHGFAVLHHGDERVRRAEVDADGAREARRAGRLDARLARLADLEQRLSHARSASSLASSCATTSSRNGVSNSEARPARARRLRASAGVAGAAAKPAAHARLRLVGARSHRARPAAPPWRRPARRARRPAPRAAPASPRAAPAARRVAVRALAAVSVAISPPASSRRYSARLSGSLQRAATPR